MASVKGRKGIGGRPPKPTEQLKADGGYRADRHGKRADVLVKPASLKAPSHLSQHGKRAWSDIVESLPEALLTKLDLISLVSYCDLIDSYNQLQPMFKNDPLDKDVRIAYFAVIQNLDRIGRQFGWSPQSRAALTLTPDKEDEDDPVESLTARLVG